LHVKGTSFVARQREICRLFGEERWQLFLESLASKDAFFTQQIFPTTKVPIKSFLTLHEELVTEFFDGDESWYWKLGEAAARWSFSEGPFSRARFGSSAESFFSSGLAAVWSSFFDFGRLEGSLEGGVLHLRIEGLPLSHQYFSKTTVAFLLKAMEICGAQGLRHEATDDTRPDRIELRCKIAGWRPD
jgi:hypothetical protein